MTHFGFWREQEEREEEIALLNRYLAKLTSRQREVLILCVVEGKTHMEAAEVLGTRSAGNFRQSAKVPSQFAPYVWYH